MLPAYNLETPEAGNANQSQAGKQVSLEAKRLEKQSNELVEKAKALQVQDNQTFQEGFEFVRAAKKGMKGVEALYKPVKQSIDRHKKDVLDLERSLQAPFKEVVSLLNPKLVAYEREQERIRQEEQRRIQEEQRKKEEEERLKQAVAAEEQGQVQAAEQILNTPAPVPMAVIPKTTPKIAGTAFVERWSAEVTNLMALVQAVAARQVPINALQANMTVLNSQARSLKSNLNWPGVRAVSNTSPSVRT